LIKDIAYDYYINKDKNCSEAVFLAYNDYYNLGATKEAIKCIGVFGGGLGCESICGALSGGAAAIGLKYSNGHAHSSYDMMEKVKSFTGEFQEAFASDLCEKIKPVYKQEDIRCWKTVEKACELLEKYMA
jgi:C_GCAxxG_C_C family probable redox protein